MTEFCVQYSHSNFPRTKCACVCGYNKRKYMLFAQLISSHPTIMQILAYSGIGFLVVMFVLAFQSILTSLLGMIFTGLDKKQ